MKILILANNDVGLYQFRKDLIYELLKNNEVFISLPYGELVELLVEAGCNFIDTPIERRGMNPLKDIKLFFQYIKILKKVGPDVVLTYTIKPNVYGGLACRLKKRKYIANVTGLGSAIEDGGILQKFTLFLYKIGLKKAKKVFFQNRANQKFMTEKNIITCENELLPGSGVNLEEHCYEPYPDNDDNVILLIIGRIMHDKGTDEILAAAEIIKKEYPQVIFRFIGDYDGDYQEKIKQYVDDGIIEFLGKQSNVHEFIKESHATLHASHHEGMSNVLLETAACGRPIIATNIPGCIETYVDGISGISFNQKDVSDLERAIKKFLSLNYDQKNIMGKAGRLKMEKEFDRKIITYKYLETIK